jgi:hypothetical protein
MMTPRFFIKNRPNRLKPTGKTRFFPGNIDTRDRSLLKERH